MCEIEERTRAQRQVWMHSVMKSS